MFSDKIKEDLPSASEYIGLRVAAGLSPKSIEAAEVGLNNSIYCLSIRDDEEKLVGMGRIIGDGGCFFQIVDIAVDPAYQGQGFGKAIMYKLNEFLEKQAPEGAYVSLLADVPADRLYKKFGFEYTAPSSVGMFKRF